jgi:hypothetical protein
MEAFYMKRNIIARPGSEPRPPFAGPGNLACEKRRTVNEST